MSSTTPTSTGLRIRSAHDARVIFHAVALGILPLVTQRLRLDGRHTLRSGNIYVWEEKPSGQDITSLGIERWTDGIPWRPTRVRREGFILYHQEYQPNRSIVESDRPILPGENHSQFLLVKQTFTATTIRSYGKRKWHLVAYFTPSTVEELDTIDDRPALASLEVPHENYQSPSSLPKGTPRKSAARARRTSPAGASGSSSSRSPTISPARTIHPLPQSSLLRGDLRHIQPLTESASMSEPEHLPITESTTRSLSHLPSHSREDRLSSVSSSVFCRPFRPPSARPPIFFLTPTDRRLAPLHALEQCEGPSRHRMDQKMLDSFPIVF